MSSYFFNVSWKSERHLDSPFCCLCYHKASSKGKPKFYFCLSMIVLIYGYELQSYTLLILEVKLFCGVLFKMIAEISNWQRTTLLIPTLLSTNLSDTCSNHCTACFAGRMLLWTHSVHVLDDSSNIVTTGTKREIQFFSK